MERAVAIVGMWIGVGLVTIGNAFVGLIALFIVARFTQEIWRGE